MFKNCREFYKKFPSRMYVCCYCGYMTNSPYECPNCHYRANGLLKTMDKGYKFKIDDKDYETFKPVELEKGKQNE